MLKTTLITTLLLFTLTGCITSEESLDDTTASSSSISSTTNSSSSTNISQSSSLSSSSDRSSSSATSVESSSSVSSISSSTLSSSSSSSVADSSSSISSSSSSSTGTIVPSSSSSSSSTLSSSSSTLSSSSSSLSSISSSSSSSSITSSSSSSSSVANAYLERVDIPQYDPDNPTHVLITTGNGMWTSSVLNDPNYKHFYVEPGRYATKINLTASGSKNSRRTISLYNGNDTHPAALSASMVADVRIWFKGADYWVVDRISNIDDTIEPASFRFYKNAIHNILNRLHLKNYSYGIIIEPYSNYNTIQNSYLDNMTHAGRMDDHVGIAIHNMKNENAIIIGTKIINNDIRNANDGIQTVVSSRTAYEGVSCEGTVIDSNRIWMDGDIYTNGNYATDGYVYGGSYQIGEQAIDLKAGSADSLNPVVITNNILWGYQKSDPTADGNFSVLNGTAFVFTNGIANVKIEGNTIFDSQRGLQIANAGTNNIEIKNNIFYRLNRVNPDDDRTYASFVYNSTRVSVAGNTFVDIPTNSLGKGSFFRFENTSISRFVGNVVVSSYGTSTKGSNTVDNNYFYASTQQLNGVNNHIFATADEAKMGDYTFTYERFTKVPKQKTLKGVVTTRNSPHYGKVSDAIPLNSPDSLKIYLDVAGSDKNDGLSLRSPILTLAKAQSVAKKLVPLKDRDIEILIASGTYYGQRVEWSFSMPDHTVTFRPLDKAAPLPIFDGFSSDANRNISLAIKITTRAEGERTNIHIKNLVFQNYKGAISFYGNREKPQPSSSYNVIEGCYFKNAGIESYSVIGVVNSSHNQIVNNHFEDVLNNKLLHAIYLAHNSSSNKISYNSFKNCDGDPVRIRDNSNDNIVSRNRFTECGYYAAVSEWFCNKDRLSYCTKTSVECPSYDNLVLGNEVSSKGGPGYAEIYSPIYIGRKYTPVTGCEPAGDYQGFIDQENSVF